MTTATALDPDAMRRVADRYIAFLESNEPPADLFEPDVFSDVTLPRWRLQADDVPGLVAIRVGGHCYPGAVARHRLDPTQTGFVLEVEERWTDEAGGTWYCRELFRADVSPDGRISRLSVYCTGDWDEALVARHAAEVRLLRP
jgi:hypothetical protein